MPRTTRSAGSTTWSVRPPSPRTWSSPTTRGWCAGPARRSRLFSLILLPWIGYIAISLPSRQLSPNYDIAWAGFDVLLLAGLAATAYFALRRSRYLTTAASATATLLIVDAWFDCMTTPAGERWQSFVLCGVVELPLAALCLWLSFHTHQIAERRIRLLLRQHPLPRPGRRVRNRA